MAFDRIGRFVLSLSCLCFAAAETNGDWPQGPGPNANFQVDGAAPTVWSVARDENIAWKITLPETGQSTPVVANGRVFFTTLKPVDVDSELGSDVVAWCCDAQTGDVLWQREIPGKYPLRLSGCFSDSSAPAPVCSGERVVFINASGTIACFTRDGQPCWQRESLAAGRTIPVVNEGQLIFTRQIYPPEPNGVFPHKYVDSPPELWTQLQALDIQTGEPVWNTTCGVNMGCSPLLQTLSDGRTVMVVGRGGGHGPPEKPEGISLIDARDGSTLWTLPLEKFMSTMTFSVRKDEVHLFHGSEHLSVDAKSGEIVRRVSITADVPVRRFVDGSRVTRRETLPDIKKGRMITQGSNLLVGADHYFRSYTHPYLGRVNVDDGTVEYVELPLQLSRKPGAEDEWLWYETPPPKQKKKDPGAVAAMKDQAIVANEVKNSRGLIVMGDRRSVGNGWGHIAAPTMTATSEHVYVPVMNGTVYVVKRDAPSLDENAIVAINDLGLAGKSWTRASLSFDGEHVYAHTIGALICIGN